MANTKRKVAEKMGMKASMNGGKPVFVKGMQYREHGKESGRGGAMAYPMNGKTSGRAKGMSAPLAMGKGRFENIDRHNYRMQGKRPELD